MKTTTIFTFVIAFLCNISFAQEDVRNKHLEGLTKGTVIELANKQINLDGNSFPVYNEKGEKVEGDNIFTLLTSGDYFPDFYIDENKDIKAAVLRKATEEEKGFMVGNTVEEPPKGKLVGEEAISFSAKNMKGKEISLDDLDGKIVVVNFWFIECKPCVMEMPDLNELVEKYKGEEDVVFLAFAQNGKSQLESFLEENEFLYQIIPSSSSISSKYGIKGYPSHIIIDQKGEIIHHSTGLGPFTVKNIDKKIKKLLKNKG